MVVIQITDVHCELNATLFSDSTKPIFRDQWKIPEKLDLVNVMTQNYIAYVKAF